MEDTEQQISFLLEKLDILREQMPETPLDAEKKAMEIGLIEEQLAELYMQKGEAPQVTVRSPSRDDLTEQIASITDELMQIEIKMLKAEMECDDDEKVKLQMCASSLKSRRQTLIDEVRDMNTPVEKKEESDMEKRLSALEKEVADIKTLLYQILRGRE